MNFSDPLFLIISVIFLSLILIGIITLLVMKKINVKESVRSFTSVGVTFLGLIYAGILVYVVSMSMMSNVMSSRQYKEYKLADDDNSRIIIVKEYNSLDGTGFELYMDDSSLGEIKTDNYLPFKNGEYQTEWKNDILTLYYTYKNLDGKYEAKLCRIDLKAKTVSESETTDVRLSVNNKDASE